MLLVLQLDRPEYDMTIKYKLIQSTGSDTHFLTPDFTTYLLDFAAPAICK